jgi:hypothetical protein
MNAIYDFCIKNAIYDFFNLLIVQINDIDNLKLRDVFKPLETGRDFVHISCSELIPKSESTLVINICLLSGLTTVYYFPFPGVIWLHGISYVTNLID